MDFNAVYLHSDHPGGVPAPNANRCCPLATASSDRKPERRCSPCFISASLRQFSKKAYMTKQTVKGIWRAYPNILNNVIHCFAFEIRSLFWWLLLKSASQQFGAITAQFVSTWPACDYFTTGRRRLFQTTLPLSLLGQSLPWNAHGLFTRVCFHLTHYNTVLANVDVGADLCRVHHAVLLNKDVVSDVQWEKRHSAGEQVERKEKWKLTSLFEGRASNQKVGREPVNSWLSLQTKG